MAASAAAERNELNVLTGRPNSTSVSSAKLKSSPKIRVRIMAAVCEATLFVWFKD
jgi:hypothetical protein